VSSEILQEFYGIFFDVLGVFNASSTVRLVSEIFGLILAAFLPLPAVHLVLHDRVHRMNRAGSGVGKTKG